MQAWSSLLHPPAPTTLGQEALKAGERACSSPAAAGWALGRQHPLGSAGREPLPAGAGSCPCSRCCRPVGDRCLQHGRRCCPPPCPPLHTFRAAKRGVDWTGRARALGAKEAGVCLIPLRDAGSAARAKRVWVAQGAGGGHRPRARRGRAGGCPRVSPSIPGARPAPSRTILVGVASWVFTVKAARLSLVGVSRAIYVCAPVCTDFKKPNPARTQRVPGCTPSRPQRVYQQWVCVTASDVFQLTKSPLPSASSTPGPASRRPRRPPSYKETSRCCRPSRSAPRLSTARQPAAPARSQRRHRGKRGAAEPRDPQPCRARRCPAAPGGPGREAGWAVRALGFPRSGLLLWLSAPERALCLFFKFYFSLLVLFFFFNLEQKK